MLSYPVTAICQNMIC